MSEPKRLRFPISTLCLLVAVVALVISLFMNTFRHNAQLMEMTQRHNAQLVEQTERFNAQLLEMAARHNAEMKAARNDAQVLREQK
jgi:cytochrome c-type biogenesis protein CcmE